MTQKQYLAGVVGEKMFNPTLMNESIRIEWSSAIGVTTKLMDVTHPWEKREQAFIRCMRIDLNINILRHNLWTNQSLSRPALSVNSL